jgi:hypothetical protein
MRKPKSVKKKVRRALDFQEGFGNQKMVNEEIGKVENSGTPELQNSGTPELQNSRTPE